MAKNESKRLDAKVLQADIEAFQALQAITGYKPANTDYEIPKIKDVRNQMEANQELEVQTNAAAAAARDNAVAAEWKFHNMVQGAKDQVKAQFGNDSTELQAVGLKRKSEYKARVSSAKK